MNFTDPVLLCNDLGIQGESMALESASRIPPPRAGPKSQSSGHDSVSVKEAVRIAQSNNFMGLVCSSSLLVSLPLSLPILFTLGPPFYHSKSPHTLSLPSANPAYLAIGHGPLPDRLHQSSRASPRGRHVAGFSNEPGLQTWHQR